MSDTYKPSKTPTLARLPAEQRDKIVHEIQAMLVAGDMAMPNPDELGTEHGRTQYARKHARWRAGLDIAEHAKLPVGN